MASKLRKRLLLLLAFVVSVTLLLALAWTFMGFSSILPFSSIYSISLDVDPVEAQRLRTRKQKSQEGDGNLGFRPGVWGVSPDIF